MIRKQTLLTREEARRLQLVKVSTGLSESELLRQAWKRWIQIEMDTERDGLGRTRRSDWLL